jgi:hypothetical protein
MNHYSFKNSNFEIQQFDQMKTFASFLPGLAGKRGIPLWAFYVNRGQGISSFGVRDKNGAILEFYPANLAYMYVPTIGFRTFVKLDGKVTEIFDPANTTSNRVMKITQSKLVIEEINDLLGIEVKVTYFGLPNEDIAALTRRIEVRNISDTAKQIEILDGIAQILPSGIDYGGYKAISNLLRSWMNVENLENDFAFYKLRSSTNDDAETLVKKDGNFYLSYVNGNLTRPITDLDLVFGYDTVLRIPRHFEKENISTIQSEVQITENKIPCGFTPFETTLDKNQSVQIDTLIGYTNDVHTINEKVDMFSKESYFDLKEQEAKDIIDELLEDVTTTSAEPMFDEYIRQNYLDNLLRGGYPMTIHTTNNSFVYYLYSRKHGDLERDYNFFTIAPEFYSQGNGNFRDVCQNRRSDILFHPEIKDYNIYVFASLIQADGYNPLSINGSTFELLEKQNASSIVHKLFSCADKIMIDHLQGKFTPGSVINLAYSNQLKSPYTDYELLEILLDSSRQNIEASYGEGYWVDHWTYILDLIENYEKIFPETMKALLFNEYKYAYYNSPVSIYPRDEKYVIDSQNQVRQYGALRHFDNIKIEQFKMNENGTNWVINSSGEIVRTNLFSKLFLLAVNKFALLDSYGLGIEMEANKPGWNDAMNGLPGLFASGISETIELKRLLVFLLKLSINDQTLEFNKAFVTFYQAIESEKSLDAFTYWDHVSTLRETYRETLRFISDDKIQINSSSITSFMKKMLLKCQNAIDLAVQLGNGIIPTYLTYEADSYDLIKDSENNPVISHYGLPKVKVKHFKMHVLPYFLEAPARYLKAESDEQKTSSMISKIKHTDLYDEVLKMYKTSSDLDAYGYEIGRIRAFTKGWLERESNFLHMTYKYLLGILKSHHYEMFFEEASTNLVFELDPEVYGRSTLENSSFIATSNNPNPHLYGQGFVSRLSGSTAEMLSIWSILVYGFELYQVNDGLLSLKLSPILPKEYFKDGIFSTTFHRVKITYQNPKHLDSWNLEPVSYTLIDVLDKKMKIDSNKIIGDYAYQVRNKYYKEIIVKLS